MYAIDLLKQEHTVIVEFLRGLETALEKLEWRDKVFPPPEYLEEAISFARDFADKHHHHKEEYVMFGMLAQKHDGDIDAQVEILRQQHEGNRTLLSAAQKAIPGFAKGYEDSARTVHQNMKKFLHTLRAHIQMEDAVFFPLVERTLSADEKRQLDAEFQRKEKEVDNGILEFSRAQVATMARKLVELS